MDKTSAWLDVVNRALTRLNKDVIESLDEGSQIAKKCNIVLPEAISSVLGLRSWRSATKRIILNADIERPLFNYSYRFQLPDDYLALVRPYTLDKDAIPYSLDNKEWTIEDNAILSNYSSICITYVAFPETPKYLNPFLVKAIVSELAYELALSLTADSSLISQLYSETLTTLDTAMKREDEGLTDELPAFHDWRKETYGESY